MRSTLVRVTSALAVVVLPLTACGSGSSTSTTSTPSEGTVVVDALDIKFDKTSYDAKAGPITIEYKNKGSLTHTLLIENHPEFKKLTVGDKDSGTVTLSAGKYNLYCDVAGHKEAGMVATLNVT